MAPIAEQEYPKSNFLINTKYSSSLLENKITAISLSKIASGEYHLEQGSYIVDMPSSEITHYLGVTGGSVYSRLKTISKKLSGRSIGWSNPEKREFEYIPVVTKASYKDNVFSVEFNRHLSQYIGQIKSSFTILSLSAMLSFKDSAGFRLYEIIKSKCYTPKGKPDTGKYVFNISLSELKLSLGVVNAEFEKVKDVLSNTTAPDWDRAVEVAPEKKYESWGEFRRNILLKGIKQINENDMTDIHVEFDTIGKGRGGKVDKIVFNVTRKHQTVLSEQEKDDILFEIRDILGRSYTGTECRTIAEEAGYDIEKVRRAKELMDGYGKDIDNTIGFLIKCIKEPFKPKKRAAEQKSKVKANFPQREYDYDELEKRLLNQGSAP